MTAWLFGVTVWIAPRGAGPVIRLLTAVRADVGRLLRADIRRYTLLFAISAAVLALGASLAIGSQSMQLLGTGQVAAQKADRLPAAVLITAQSVLDQRDSQISDSTAEMVNRAAEGRPVSSRWRATISSGASSRLVIGVTPGDWYSPALYQPTADPDRLWQGLGHGEVALSGVAASRFSVGAGGTVELPTVHGPKSYRVAGTFRPQVINDTAVGDMVLVSAQVARSDWAAVRDQIAVSYPHEEPSRPVCATTMWTPSPRVCTEAHRQCRVTDGRRRDRGLNIRGICRLSPTLDHRLGPSDVAFEATRFRHRAIARHQAPVGNIASRVPIVMPVSTMRHWLKSCERATERYSSSGAVTTVAKWGCASALTCSNRSV